MILNKKVLVSLSIAYLYIPIVLFLFGWTKLWIAIPCILALGYCVCKMLASYGKRNKNFNEPIRLRIFVLIIAIAFFLFIGYFAGLGRWVNQSYDWFKHNAILKDLTVKSWPIYYQNGSEHSMLTYYIAQYLVPAVFGKIFNSFRITEIVNYIWAEIGLILVWLNLVRLIKINNVFKQILSAIILIFFSCPLWIAQAILNALYNIHNLNWIVPIDTTHWFVATNDIILQYTNNFVLLQWVFPQIIAIWLTLLLFIENKRKIQYYLTLMLPSMLFGTLSFIGIVPIALGCALCELARKRNIIMWFKKIFSLENIITLLTLGSVLILYFYGNILCDKPDTISFRIMEYGDYWGFYFIFVIIMVLLYSLCIWIDNKKNELFYFAVISLLLLPLFKMGMWNDFMMRASIPALFILMYLIVKFLNNYIRIDVFKNTNIPIVKKILPFLVCIILIIGGSYPFSDLNDSIEEANQNLPVKETNFGTMEIFANRNRKDIPPDVQYNYYSYDIENNLFYKIVSRKK